MNGILEIKDDFLIIRLSGELDHHESQKMREQIDKAVFQGEIRNIIFDFNKVSFMDSSGIGLLMGRYRLMEAIGGTVSAFGVSKNVDKLINISGIGKIIKIFSSESEALVQGALQ